MIIFCFMIKKWQRAKFITALKSIILYELLSLLFYLIYPWTLLFSNLGILGDVLIFSIILFFIFHFIMKRYLSMNLKKSLITFLLVIVIIFPVLDYLRVEFITVPIFTKVNAKIGALMRWHHLLGIPIYDALPLVLSKSPAFNIFFQIGQLERATLSWPNDYIRGIIINAPYIFPNI